MSVKMFRFHSNSTPRKAEIDLVVPPNKSSRTDFNPSRFESIHLSLLTISAGVAWLFQYFPGGKPLVERLSFKAEDPSWVAPGYTGKPLIGVHHFGDFEYPMSMGLQLNPWNQDMPAPWLPTIQPVFTFLATLDYGIAFGIYFIASLGAIFAGSWAVARLFGKVNFWNFIRVSLIFLFLTGPTLMDFDRGNWHSLMIGLAAYFLAKTIKGESTWNVLFILFCASLKPYYILFLVAYIGTQFNKKILVFSISAFLFVNLTMWHFMTGSALEGVKLFLIDMNFYTGSTSEAANFGLEQIMHSGSLAGAATRIVEFFAGSEAAFVWLQGNIQFLQAGSLAYILAALYFIGFTKAPVWQKYFSLFSIVSLGNLGSMGYTWGWVGIVAIALYFGYSENLSSGNKQISILKQILLQLVIALTLIPSWVHTPGAPSGVFRSLPQFLILAFLILLVQGWNYVEAFRSKEPNSFNFLTAKRKIRHR